MIFPKVHIAGIPDGTVQRCVRCGAKIEDHGKLLRMGWPKHPALGFWAMGAMVLSTRLGMSVVTPDRAAKYPRCGKQTKGENDARNTHASTRDAVSVHGSGSGRANGEQQAIDRRNSGLTGGVL